jgi:DNA-directed RNA polymerase specialized sigma24 family protein
MKTENSIFPTTSWTTVLDTASHDPEKAMRAMEILCRDYAPAIERWFAFHQPVAGEAADLTQGFLGSLVKQREQLGQLDRERGKFRSFLATCLRRYGISQRRQQTAQKRGDGDAPEPLDDMEASGESDRMDELLDTELVRAARVRALSAVPAQLKSREMAERFARLRDYLFPTKEEPACEVSAADLGLAPEAYRLSIFRFRQIYVAALVVELKRLVGPNGDKEELAYLVGLHSRALVPKNPTPSRSHSGW